MKKFYTLALTLALALAANAQTSIIEWGYYDGDGSNLYGLGATSSTIYKAAMLIPGTGNTAGSKVAGLRIPINDRSTIAKFEAWVTGDMELPLEPKAIKEIAVSDLPVGLENASCTEDVYITVMFDSAIAISKEGIYVGYNLELKEDASSELPILLDSSTKSPKGGYVYANAMGEKWTAVGSDYGVLGVIALLSDVVLPDAAATFCEIEHNISAAGTVHTMDINVTSTAGRAATKIGYEVDVNGALYNGEATVNLPAGFNKKSRTTVEFRTPKKLEPYEVSIRITDVDGIANTLAEQTVTTTFNNVSRLVERNVLVEENTGTTCGYCPRGIVGMNKMRRTFGDRCIPVAIHQYSGSSSADAMYTSAYRSVGFSGAPEAFIDGQLSIDPFYGSDKYTNYALGDIEEYLAIPALVDIQLQAEWVDATKTQVKANATVESLISGDYTINYVVVIDSLHGTTKEWRQTNYYSSYSMSGDAELDEWCANGVCALNPYPYFMDVAIASSYSTVRKSKTDPLGTLAAGATAENTYTMTLPTKPTTLTKSIAENKHNATVVAFVMDAEGHVAQAVRAKVDEPAAVDELRSTVNGQGSTAIFNLAGQRVGSDYRGIVIMDGKKVMK